MLYSRYPEASLSRDRESNVLFTGRIFFSFSDYEKKRVLVPHEETEGGGTAEGRNVKKWTTTMMTGGCIRGAGWRRWKRSMRRPKGTTRAMAG